MGNSLRPGRSSRSFRARAAAAAANPRLAQPGESTRNFHSNFVHPRLPFSPLGHPTYRALAVPQSPPTSCPASSLPSGKGAGVRARKGDGPPGGGRTRAGERARVKPVCPAFPPCRSPRFGQGATEAPFFRSLAVKDGDCELGGGEEEEERGSWKAAKALPKTPKGCVEARPVCCVGCEGASRARGWRAAARSSGLTLARPRFWRGSCGGRKHSASPRLAAEPLKPRLCLRPPPPPLPLEICSISKKGSALGADSVRPAAVPVCECARVLLLGGLRGISAKSPFYLPSIVQESSLSPTPAASRPLLNRRAAK